MAHTTLFNEGAHRNLLFEDFDPGGLAVQSNQHLIIHGSAGMLLDPGGHKIYSKVLAETFSSLGPAQLTHIFLSHQDPDIIAAINGSTAVTTVIREAVTSCPFHIHAVLAQCSCRKYNTAQFS